MATVLCFVVLCCAALCGVITYTVVRQAWLLDADAGIQVLIERRYIGHALHASQGTCSIAQKTILQA